RFAQLFRSSGAAVSIEARLEHRACKNYRLAARRLSILVQLRNAHLFARRGIQPDRYRAVVAERDFHVCAKNAGGYAFAELALKRLHECRESTRGDFRRRGGAVGGPSSFARRRVERELAHREQLAADVAQRTVHYPRIVVEDAQAHDLSCKPVTIGIGIGWADAA